MNLNHTDLKITHQNSDAKSMKLAVVSTVFALFFSGSVFASDCTPVNAFGHLDGVDQRVMYSITADCADEITWPENGEIRKLCWKRTDRPERGAKRFVFQDLPHLKLWLLDPQKCKK